MDCKEVVRSDGRSGGLLLLWKKEIHISLLYKSSNYIDVMVGVGAENVWRFTGFYGEPRWQDKQLTWQYFRDLHAVVNLPWLVMGDINEIMYPFEKEGGNPRPQHYMKAFRDAMEESNLSDFGYTGPKFTWHRGKIRERLDRALTNEAWNTKFGDAVLLNMEYSHCDHRPIMMEFDKEENYTATVPTVLRFEAKWLKEAQFRQVVEDAWERAGPMVQNSTLAGKLAFVHDQLHKWDRAVLQKTKKKIRKAQRDLDQVAEDSLTDAYIAVQREIAKEIESML
jgi:hypothetical protein